MSLSTRYNSKTLPSTDQSTKSSDLLVEVFGNELRNKLCTKWGFKVISISPETAKIHGFTKRTTEVLVSPTLTAFYRVAMIQNVRVSKLIEINLGLYSPESEDNNQGRYD